MEFENLGRTKLKAEGESKKFWERGADETIVVYNNVPNEYDYFVANIPSA